MLDSKVIFYHMDFTTPQMCRRDQETAYGVTVPSLRDYQKIHHVRGMPPLGNLNLRRDCTRLILYNVQSHTTSQIWHELHMCLGHMASAVVKIKHVSGLNRNPHADLWVRKDMGSSLLSLIRDRTRVRMTDWGTLAQAARREREGVASHFEVKEEEMPVEIPAESTLPPRDEGRSLCVTGWRLALWQPWRECQMKPAKPQPIRPSRRPPTSLLLTM